MASSVRQLSSRSQQTQTWLLAACSLYVLAVVAWHAWSRLSGIATSAATYRSVGFPVSGYYVSYGHGFIRRGLPGAVLALFGHIDGHAAAVLFWVLTGLAYVAVLAVSVLVLGLARTPSLRVALGVVLLACPFSVVAAGDYLGRYDSVGLVALVAIAWLGRSRRLGPGAALALVSLLLAVSVLSEELLFPFFVPVVLAFVLAGSPRWRPAGSPLRRRDLFAIAAPLIVGLTCAVASFYARASAALVAEAQRAYGVPARTFDAALALGWSLRDEWDYIRPFGIANIAVGSLIWVAIFGLTLLALDWLIVTRSRWYWLSGAYLALVAVALSWIGVDWRRWWLLAFTAQLATALLLDPGPTAAGAAAARTPSGRSSLGAPTWRPLAAVLGVLLLAVVSVEFSGIFPVHLLATRVYWKSDLTYWVPGHHRLACDLGLSSSSC